MTEGSQSRMVYLSGDMVPEEEAKISIFDSSVLLGHCVTESSRTFQHRPFLLEQHIDRLYRSLKVARIQLQHTPAELLQITLNVLDANLPMMAAGDDCWIVHNISAGSLKLGPGSNQVNPATVMIFTNHLDLRGWARFYTDGCHAVTSMSRAVPSQSLDARVKNRSRMAYTIADAEARLVDLDAQCVILDIDGNVSENKGGNLFVVSDGELRTPSTDNCLAGLSRQTVIELAKEQGLVVREMKLQMYDLYTADEVFFTSTPYCMMPATKFNGLPIGDGSVGAITQQLLAAWSERVGMDIVAQAQRQI